MDSESALRRAKRPRSILAGPYGHPVHAAMITLPIGAWTASLVFDLVAIFGSDPEPFVRGAIWLVGIGTVGALGAMIFGFLDYSTLTAATRVRKIATAHMALNLAATGLMMASFLIRLSSGFDEVSVGGVACSWIALVLVGGSGALGGELTYRHGVRVADEDTQRKAYS
jgi:uncharacterized membrane protein